MPRALSSRQEVCDVRTKSPTRGEAPPSDVDEILAQIQQHWQGYWAGPIIGLVAVVVVLICLWSSWFTVQPEETGVVQRFGRVVRTAEPGLHFKWPFGIETVHLVPTARVLKEEFGFRTLATPPASARNIRALRPRAIRPIKASRSC